MIGGDTQVRRSLFDHLQHAAEHTDDSPQGPLVALGDTTAAIVVAEELIGAVDEVNDHMQSYSLSGILLGLFAGSRLIDSRPASHTRFGADDA